MQLRRTLMSREMHSVGPVTTEDCGIGSRRAVFLSVLAMALMPICLGCEMKSTAKSSVSITELEKYLSLRGNITSVSWEISSLPEGSVDSVPGPSDYVALIAILYGDTTVITSILTALPPVTSVEGFPRQFVRDWLHGEALNAVKKLGLGTSPSARDASALVKRVPKRALAQEFQGGVAIYVEYVSP